MNDKTSKIKTLIENVNANLIKGNVEAATAMSELLLEIHPTHFDVLMLSARIKLQNSENDEEAINNIEKATFLSKNENPFCDLSTKLYQSGKLNAAEKVANLSKKKWPHSPEVYNILSSIFKEQKRLPESIEAAKKSIELSRNNYKAWMNLGISLLLYQDYKQALEALTKAVELNKNSFSLHLQAGAYISIQEYQHAQEILEEALRLNPGNYSIIIDLCATHYNRSDYDSAMHIISAALVNDPENTELLKTKAVILRQMGRVYDTIEILENVLKTNPKDLKSWIFLGNAYYHALGNSIKARECYNNAYAINPESREAIEKLCTFLQETREGAVRDNIEISHKLACKLIDITHNKLLIAAAVQPSLLTVLDYEQYSKLGSHDEVLRACIGAFQMSRVKTMEDRLNFVDAHIKQGKIVEESASKKPLVKKVKQRLNNKVRIGILSSDLRHHPVGYFAWPIAEYINKDYFELYCYSAFPYEVDSTQRAFMQKSEKFHVYREESIYEIAQSIHDDQLDILFELGGRTLYNRLEACAYKPAQIQCSWLGYPHSIGMPTAIDYILVDPYLKPSDSRLLIEKPFIVPETWVSIHEMCFPPVLVANTIPEDKNGYITFGTMNAAHKLTPETFATWASIMHSVPNSRFLYVRLETDSQLLRDNFCKHMASHGITKDRIAFKATNEHHLPFYNEIDIALDTFPHTGGTTTCETLWMGVPVVTLVGPAMFERLSYSNVTNAGLNDLCAFTIEDYKKISIDLARDKDRRRHLKLNLRTQIINNPLGQPRRFVDGFCKTVLQAIGKDIKHIH